MGEVVLVTYRPGRDESYRVVGVFSNGDKAREWTKQVFSSMADYRYETMTVDRPGSPW